mgnify:CR=1 FL=1
MSRLCIVREKNIKDLEREDIQHIAASFERTAFVTNKQELYIYDHDEDVVPREPVFRNVIHVSMSESHVLFLDREHNLYAFGSNLFGQVGILPSSQNMMITKPVNLNKSHESISRIEFKSCCAGGHHSSAIDTNGDLYSWGCGELGELGTSLGKTHLHTHDRAVGLYRHTPTRISSRVQQISCGYAHNAIVTLDGELKCFGWGLYVFSHLFTRSRPHTTTLMQIRSTRNELNRERVLSSNNSHESKSSLLWILAHVYTESRTRFRVW